MSVTTIERRRRGRYACDWAIEIEWGSEILRATPHDINQSGMFGLTNNPLGMRAELSARIINSLPVQGNCIVKRIELGRGMGVKFSEVPEDSRKPPEELLWKLEGG